MIPSGIQPLDERIDGLAPGRVHLMAGGVGTGKSTAALQFLAAGARGRETAALLTRDTPAELAAHADYLRFELEDAMADRRLTVLRFGPRFARRLARGTSAASAVEELRREWAVRQSPERVVIDPVSPFLADGQPAGAGLMALVELLRDIRATVLLTWPGPVAGGEDRRLDPLVECAAVVATLSRRRSGGFAMRIDRARLTGAPQHSIPFTVARGEGIVETARLGADRGTAERLPATGVGGS